MDRLGEETFTLAKILTAAVGNGFGLRHVQDSTSLNNSFTSCRIAAGSFASDSVLYASGRAIHAPRQERQVFVGFDR